MSGCCGWFGRSPVDDPVGVIDRMASALPNYAETVRHVESGTRFGLATLSHPATGSLARVENAFAAIEGYPRWTDPSIAEIATRRNHGHALLVAYQRKGLALFDILRGAFSFIIVDSAADTVVGAIDRLGVQTMCYAQPLPGLIVLGSTTDAVRAHPKVAATISPQSIYDYLYFVDRVPAPFTIYQEQKKLAPGEYLVMEKGEFKLARYWHMPYRSSARIDKRTAAEQLKLRLRQAVQDSLVGEQPASVGAFLSGGLDSSSVVGVAAGLLPCKLQTFTIGFPVEGFDEAQFAAISSQHFGTRQRTYYLTAEDVTDVVLKAVRIYDEPFANSSFIPAYHCARLAREAGVDMMLAGDGGDELFAGNKRYVDDRIFDYYHAIPKFLREGAIDPLARHLAFARNVPVLKKGLGYVEKANWSTPRRLADNLFVTSPPEEIFTAELLGAIDPEAPGAFADSIYAEPPDASKVQRMMQLDLRLTLADSDLRKVVRMCELAGVRSRFPFLDDDLAEFSASLPEALLLERGNLRQFYKDAMRGFLPNAVIDKQKHGFGLPYMAYMNSHPSLRALIADNLTDLKRRRYFRPDFLDGLSKRSREGRLAGHDAAALDLAILNLWLAARE